ncbi:uncharacterized protein LOC134267333 [Saccostrea cucullata]|uniref:uncharacterized protein LOC134267333 n=1 Tax=Saccostrea cuccullata TaxID=36930 RepID=UPI002ED18423
MFSRFRAECTRFNARCFTEKTIRAVSEFIDIRHEDTLFRSSERTNKLSSAREVTNITQAVKFMMNKIILESSGTDYRFKVKQLQLIGSMYEDTKIRKQNEFDFFAVFGYNILKDKNIHLEPGCRPGFTKIRINGSSHELSDCCQGLYLSPHVCMKKFESLLPSQLGDFEPVKTTSGILRGWKRRKRTFDLVWENGDFSMIIAVDVMPAFLVYYKNLPKTLREDCTDNRMDQIGADHSSFLIPRSCEHHNEGKCWHNSFAHAESTLIKNMDNEKKRCHRVLKLLFVSSDRFGNPNFLSSYSLKSTIMYKSKRCYENEFHFLLYVFVHFAKCFDQTCMPTYFLTKTNIWKNIIEHRTHNSWGSNFLYDFRLSRQILRHVSNADLEERFAAWNVAVVLEFWRRMMILLVVLFSRAQSSMTIDFFLSVIYHSQAKQDKFYMDYLTNKKVNWLLSASQYDVLTIRANHRKMIRTLDIPVFTELTNELQKYGMLDVNALNSLVKENRYDFKIAHNSSVSLDVHRYANIYLPYRSSCRTEAIYRHNK